MLIQLDLFHELTEVEILQERVRLLEKSMDKQRKKMFANIGQLNKVIVDLQNRLDILESHICKTPFDILWKTAKDKN